MTSKSNNVGNVKPKAVLPEREPKTLEEWVEFAKLDFVGKPEPEAVWDTDRQLIVSYGISETDLRNLVLAMGDDNPLYTDPVYAARTRWSGLIAPPYIFKFGKYTGGIGVVFSKGIQVASLNGGLEVFNYDVIRPGTRIHDEKIISDVVLKQGGRTGQMAIVYGTVTMWDEHNQVVCKSVGWSLRPQKFAGGGAQIARTRDIYQYSAVEKEKIIKDIESYPPRRGSKIRYWEDVNVGEKLPVLCTGPLTFKDFMDTGSWTDLQVTPGDFEIGMKGAIEKARHPELVGHLSIVTSVHPDINMEIGYEHTDWILCKSRGIPLPFDFGVFRSSMASIPITDWMGDDGWLFRTKTMHRETYLIGDCLWIGCEVAGKEKRKEGAAVEIRLNLINQFGATVTTGDATVLLPSRTDGPVKLPIPVA